ncbi:MAG TPA: hypothetical protein VGE52_03710, partial [Pirellulales bacterium]
MTNRDATNRLDLRACRMWMDRWNRSFRRVGPRRTPAGARTRSMLVGCEPLEPRLALTTFYVDDSWAGFTDGQAITDADLLLSNDQAASFGTSGAVVGATAFATIADAIQAAVNAGGSGHIIKINTGTYAESITFTESGSIAQIESLATGPDFVALNSFTLQAGLQMSGNWQTSGGFTVDAALTLAGDSHTGEVLPADMLINAAGGVTFLVGSQLNGSTAGGQGLTITSTSDVDLRGVGQGTALAFLNVQTTGALKLFDNISTSKAGGGSGALSFDATAGVQLNGLVTIATGGGDVTVNGAIDGAHVLTINAGLGDVDFQQAIGSGTPGGLVGLDVTGDEVDFAAATKVGAGGLSVTADEVSFASGASVTGLTGGGATLNVGSLLTIASGANFKLDGAFQQTGAGNVLLGADVLTEGALSFAGPISLTGDVVLSSDANQDGTGGDLTLSGAVASSIDEGFGLQIVRGANAATFAALGGLGNRLKSLAVLSTSGALGITKLGGDLFIGAGGVEFTSLVASDQKVQLQGDVAINSLGDVDLAAADVTALVNGGQSLTITAPGGV